MLQKLTNAQRRAWDVDGFIQLEGVLSADEVSFFSDQLDELRRKPGWEPMGSPIGHYAWMDQTPSQDPEGFMDRRDLLPYHDAFIAMIDRPGVFDLIVDLMGPYLAFSMSQAIVRPSTDKFPGYTHTDGGEGLRRIRVTETSRPLAMKALYLLTDVTEPESSNFTVFPGSHMRPFPEPDDPPVSPDTPGAVPLLGRAGDCILFPHSLWHGPGRNSSGRARKTLLYNYCQLFMRPYDYETVAAVKDRCTRRQRRLLGDLGYDFRPGSYTYVPEDQLEVILENP
jgi:hypothetical protein